MKFRTGLLAATAFAAAMTGSSAFAQDGIEVITVTAAKREQNVQDVPISMNVIGGASLEKFNSSSLASLSASVPNLLVTRSPTNSGLFMRGFGTGPANPTTDMAVSVYQDGIWQEKARNLMIDFFDVQRIEVLRGAQGALVGKNTQIGAISIITNDPEEEFSAAVTVNYNFDYKGVDTYGYITGALTDDLSARLALKFVDQGGYIKNNAYGTDEPAPSSQFGRLSLKFTPSESITNVLKIEYHNWDQRGNFQLPGNPALSAQAAAEAACCTKNDLGPQGRFNYDRQHGWRLSNRLDIDLGDGYTLQSISGYTYFNSNSLGAGAATNPSGFGTNWVEQYSAGSQEFRVLSPTGEGRVLDWILGAHADYSNYHFQNPIDYGSFVPFIAGVPGSPGFGAVLPQAGGLTLANYQAMSSYSVYASGTWHITDDLRLVGNARYTRVSKTARYTQTQRYGTRTASSGGVLGNPLFTGLLASRNGNQGSSFFDPSITAQYELFDDRVMVYASWAKGSKGAAFDFANRVSTTFTATNFVFKPETSTNWEVGLKSTPWDWLTFNVSAFIVKVKSMQVSGFDPTVNTLITRNAGVAESKGVEVELNVRPMEGLSINNNINYVDARFTDFPGAGCPSAGPYFKPGCTPATNNNKGLPMHFVPAWSGNSSINFNTPIMDGLVFDVVGSVEWRSKMWRNPGYVAPYGDFPGYSKFNLRVGIGAEDDSWEVAFVGENLTNTHVDVGAATFWGLETGKAPETEIFLDELRNISIQGTLRF